MLLMSYARLVSLGPVFFMRSFNVELGALCDSGPVGVEGASPMEGAGDEAREEDRLPASEP